MYSYWQRQTPDTPLYPDIEWERPERRDQAGSLLIIGGSTHAFIAVHDAFQAATEAGIGQARALVPEQLRKLTKHFPSIAYAESTSTGFFGGKSFETMLYAAAACDGVMLAGDVGRNSETAITFAQFVRTYNGPLAITKDAFDCLYSESGFLAQRENTLLVLAEGQLQRFLKEQASPIALTSTLDLPVYVERLHRYSSEHSVSILTRHGDVYVLAHNGEIVTTTLDVQEEIWRVRAAARAIVAWLHHRDKPLEGISASILNIFA